MVNMKEMKKRESSLTMPNLQEINSKHPEVDDALLANIVKSILSVGKPLKIVFFGSRQRGDHRSDSDLDLMIIEEMEDQKELQNQLLNYKEASEDLYPKLNLFVRSAKEAEEWSKVTNYLVTRALAEGRLLFEDSYRWDNCVAKYRKPGQVAEEELHYKNYADFAAQMLQLGDRDLEAAKLLIDKDSLQLAGFHAQQATEKYFKAYLVLNQQKFDKDHDLDKLREQIQKIVPIAELDEFNLKRITEYAVEARYDGTFAALIDEVEGILEVATRIRKIIVERLPLRPTPDK
jgi:HEPN domain-containing protein/predicted nucleotidyltransferase